MAKKFAEITGIHKIFNTAIEDPDLGTIAYTEMSISDNDLELKSNIDENTIVFVTADNTDAGRIIGPNKYKISKDDCFIIAQNKVFGAFGKINVSDVMGPAGKDGAGVYSLTDSQKANMIRDINTVQSFPEIDEGGLMAFLKAFVNNETGLSSTVLDDINIVLENWSKRDGINGSFIVDSTLFTRDMNLNYFNLKNYYDLKGDIGPQGPAGPAGTSVSMPVGSIIMFAGDEAPDDWVFCKGQVIPTIDIEGTQVLPLEKYEKYQKLVSVIKKSYVPEFPLGGYDIESGDLISINSNIEGQTVANLVYLPDFSLRFPYGAKTADNLGQTGGQENVLLTSDECALPEHTHPVLVDTDSTNSYPKPAVLPNGLFSSTNEAHPLNQTTNSESDYTKDTFNSYNSPVVYPAKQISATTAHTNMPPYLVVNFIIKYK